MENFYHCIPWMSNSNAIKIGNFVIAAAGQGFRSLKRPDLGQLEAGDGSAHTLTKARHSKKLPSCYTLRQNYLQAVASAAHLPNPTSGCFCFFVGFHWKYGFWCIRNLDFCVVQPSRGLFLQENITLINKKTNQ